MFKQFLMGLILSLGLALTASAQDTFRTEFTVSKTIVDGVEYRAIRFPERLLDKTLAEFFDGLDSVVIREVGCRRIPQCRPTYKDTAIVGINGNRVPAKILYTELETVTVTPLYDSGQLVGIIMFIKPIDDEDN